MILDWTSYSWESDMMSNPLPWIFGAQDEVTKQRSGGELRSAATLRPTSASSLPSTESTECIDEDLDTSRAFSAYFRDQEDDDVADGPFDDDVLLPTCSSLPPASCRSLPSGSCSRQGLSADLAGGPDRMLPYSAIGPGARLCSEYAATMAAATKSLGEPRPDVAFFSDWPRMEPSRNQSNNSSRESDVPAFQLPTSVLQREDALRNSSSTPSVWARTLHSSSGHDVSDHFVKPETHGGDSSSTQFLLPSALYRAELNFVQQNYRAELKSPQLQHQQQDNG